jgi:hypothetical protein
VRRKKIQILYQRKWWVEQVNSRVTSSQHNKLVFVGGGCAKSACHFHAPANTTMLFLLWNLVASVALEFVDFDCDVIIIVFFFWLAVFCYGGWRGAAAAVGWLYAIFVLILGMLWPILRSLLFVYGAIMWGTMAITFGIIVTCQNCCGMVYHKNRSRILDKYDQHKKRSHSDKDDSSCDDAELHTSGKRKKLVAATNDRQRSAVKESKSSSSRQRFDEFDEMIEMDSLSAIKRKGKIRSLADDSATKRRAPSGRKSSSSSKSNADDWFGTMKKEVMKFYNMMKKHDLVP